MHGKTVSHYKILEKLGEGGMGVVYRARDTRLERDVALKFLPADLTRDPEAKERFVHEARAASSLDHQSICTVYEIGESEDGQMFIAMACYGGETLRDRLKKGPFTYYGYRAAERIARLAAPDPVNDGDATADLPQPCVEGPCSDDPLASFDTDDGPPVWTDEIRQVLSRDPAFRKTLELMQVDLRKEAAQELWLLQDRLPKKRGMLIGLAKAFFELGDYNRSLQLVLRKYERYLEGMPSGASEDLWLLAYPQGYWDHIQTYSRKYGQDPYFIAAIIREESQFSPEALSPAGARGLMQVMPATGEWVAQTIKLPGFDRAKLFESEMGINIGTWYISHLMKRFKNDPLLVAASYNAGPEAVAGWISKNGYTSERDLFVEAIPFAETRGYVKKVLRNYAEYRRIYGRGGDGPTRTSSVDAPISRQAKYP